tara:strand:- start:365 stop:691 length:327 start_codon:yes stop_codon:yes gene_type:complete
MHEIIHIGVMNVVKTINNMEMPSTPNLNFIKLFIQFCSSTNWKSALLGSNEYHKNKDNRKVATLLNKEIYITLLLFVLSFDKKIKKELTKGKKIKVDNIGKFIYFKIK